DPGGVGETQPLRRQAEGDERRVRRDTRQLPLPETRRRRALPNHRRRAHLARQRVLAAGRVDPRAHYVLHQRERGDVEVLRGPSPTRDVIGSAWDVRYQRTAPQKGGWGSTRRPHA